MQRVPDFIFERQVGGSFLPRSRSAPATTPKASANRPLELLVLEDRVFYSATPLEPLDTPTEPQSDPLELSQQLDAIEDWTGSLLTSSDASVSADGTSLEPSNPDTSKPGSTLIVIDQGIADHESLLQDIRNQLTGNYSVLLIESSADGWLQLNDYLAKQSGIEEVHLFSHGAAGRLQLGAAQVDLDNLLNDEAAAIWQRALNPNAELMLYGCDIAADGTGIDFVKQFAQFSGAEVAASTDQTGTGPAGDWVLEFATGSIETPRIWTDGQDGEWEGLLATTFSRSGIQDFAANDRGSPRAVAMHSDGSFVMVWTDSTIDGQGTGIAGQRFDANGNAIGSVFQVNNIPYATGDQTHASIDMDASGRFVVAWVGKDANNEGINARLFNADGTPVANTFVVNQYTQGSQLNPNVSMGDDGRFVVVWEGTGAADSAGIYARAFNSSGTAVTGDILVNTTTGNFDRDAVVSMNSSGNFAVSWEDGTGFHYQRFDNLGNKQASPILVDPSLTAGNGSILLNDDNSVVVVWQEQELGGMWSVRYAGYSNSNTATIPNSIVLANTSFSQYDPSIAGSGDGDFVIAWQSGEFGLDSNGIYHQAYNTSGNLTSYTFLTNDNFVTGTQEHASVAVNRLGNFVVVWSGQSATDLNDIGFDLTNLVPPDAEADTSSATEAGGVNNGTPGQSSTGNVLANDKPRGSTGKSVVVGVAPGVNRTEFTGVGSSCEGNYGSLILNSNGSFTYTVNDSLAAVQALRDSSTTLTDTFTYTIRDDSNFFSCDSITITIFGTSDAPTAIADKTTAVEAGGLNNDAVGTNPTGNVLTNDTDPDAGDTKTVTGVAAGTKSSASGNVGVAVAGNYGSITIASNGSFAYMVDNLNASVQRLRNSSQTLTETFTYTFSDSAGLTSTGQITITIEGANDTPTIAPLTSATIGENTANGTAVAIATALEVDSNDAVTFLLSNNAGGRFTIDSSTGLITVDSGLMLDYESATNHSITIRVTDSSGAFSEQAVIINLSDVNEFNIGTLSDNNALPNTIAENASNGTAVQITAFATDSDGSAVVTYSLDDSAGGRFHINSTTGIVTKAGALDFESSTSHTITVRATSSDGSFTTANFTIAVTDFNEYTPTVPTDNDLAINEVVENSPADTRVGIAAYSLDADGSNNTITYSLTDSAVGRFAIDRSTGVVTLTGAGVNFELANSHDITVRATSSDGSFTSQIFTINVLNGGNEINGISDTNPNPDALTEDATLGSSVITALASHPDGLAITYSLTNDAGNRFSINSSTGVVTLASALNYETGTSHLITIRADASDGSFAAQDFSISVQDINEFTVGTITDINATANSIEENSDNGTDCRIKAFASDADGTTNAISYSLDDSAGGKFAINASTGIVTIADSSLLNYEAASSHTIVVRATSADSSFSTQSFTINLTDVDEFDVGPVSDFNAAANSVAENSANGTMVGITASALDPDATTNSIAYSLDDDAGGRFTINSSTGLVTVANGTLLDREASPSHSVTIRATSADGSSSTSTLVIDIGNTNEAPMATGDHGEANEAGGLSNSSVGSNATGNVLANDFDPDAGDVLTIIGVQAGTHPPLAGSVGAFVSGTYGTLLLNANGSYTYTVNNAHPDVEALRGTTDSLQDTFTYRISDAGGLESTSQLVLTITGTNDTPYSMWSETGLRINTGAANNQYLQVNDFGSLLAGDQFTLRLAISTTASSGALLSYATSSDNDELRLQMLRGKLWVYLDGQQWNTSIATSLLADGQRHELSMVRTVANGQIDIYIDGVLRDTNSNRKPGYRLEAGGSLVLGQIQNSIGGSFDPNEAFHGTFWDMSIYSTAWDATKLNLAGGQTQHSAPDLKGHWDFDLFGSNAILDLIGGRHGSLLSITPSSEWTAGNADLVQADWQPQIAENSVTGTVISSLRAQDVDAGEVLTWSLIDDAGGRFAIDSRTGLLTVANSELLNFEEHQTHTVIVRVTDAGGLFREETYTFHLTDVQESPVSVPVDLDPTENRVFEHASTGTSTGIQAWAIDEDGALNEVTFSLLDNEGGLFTINSQTGIVSVLNGSLLDREQAASHQITVRATSADGTFEDKVFTIQVEDIDEFDIDSIADLDPTSDTLAENAGAGTTVGVLAHAIDPDATQSTVHYSLDDNAGGRFDIDSQTGVVTVASAGLLDYETATSHIITVRATSQDGSASITEFTIQLTDVNEFEIGPIIDSVPIPDLVFENSLAGTYTGVTAFAQDQDATQNSVSWRLLDDDGGRFAIDPVTGEIFTTQTLDFELLGSVRQVRVEGSSADGSRREQDFQIELGNVLTETFTVFSGLDVAMTPQELLLSSSDGGGQYQSLVITDLPTIGKLYLLGEQGKQVIGPNELYQLAIPVGQKIVYEAPTSGSGSVTVAYAASTAGGQSRTGTVTIQVEPAIVFAPPAPASSTFTNSSISSIFASSSSSTSGSSSSSSSSGESNSSQTSSTTAAESTQSTATAGNDGASAGAAAGAVGVVPATGASLGSDTMAGEAAGAGANSGDGAGSSSGDSRDASAERENSGSSSDETQLISSQIGQHSQNGVLQINNESGAATRILASATSIQQTFFATAQFSEYLNKLNSALEETPLIVGFEMPTYATAGASLFTVGYVAWLIRGGVLLTSFMSSIPSWQSFDPLPILENAGPGDDDLAERDDTSIAELVDSVQPAQPSFASTG